MPAGLLVATLLAGCVGESNSIRTGQPVEVCSPRGCVRQDPSVVTAETGPDRRLSRPQDPNAWNGEPTGPLREAADSGDVLASYRLGLAHLVGAPGAPRSAREAVRRIAPAAEAGDAWAQYRLAELVSPTDPGRARSLLEAAAAQGHGPSAYLLGARRLRGQPPPADPVEAARLFTIAGEAGVPEAQYNLALLSWRGTGVPLSPGDAYQWMRVAAQNGVVPAQSALGRMHATGLTELGQDLAEAQLWLQAAASQGDADAKRLLPDVERALAQQRSTVAEAKVQAEAQRQLLQNQILQTQLWWQQALLFDAWYGRRGYDQYGFGDGFAPGWGGGAGW